MKRTRKQKNGSKMAGSGSSGDGIEDAQKAIKGGSNPSEESLHTEDLLPFMSEESNQQQADLEAKNDPQHATEDGVQLEGNFKEELLDLEINALENARDTSDARKDW